MKNLVLCLGIVLTTSLSAQQFLLFPGNSGSSNITWATSDVALDQEGNKIIVGAVNNSGTHDFLPGPDILQLTPGAAAAHFLYSGFVASYSREGELNYLVNIKDEDIPTDVRLLQVDVDAQGNCYILGTLRGKADFDPGPGTFELQAANVSAQLDFVAAYDNSGGLIYALPLGMSNLVFSAASYDEDYTLKADDAGNIYVALKFPDTSFDFDPGSGEYTPSESHVFSFSPSGDFRYGYAIPRIFFDLDVDANGNQYIVGDLFNGTEDDFDFDPSVDTLTIPSDSSSFYFSSYTANGELRLVEKITTTEIPEGNLVASAFDAEIAVAPNGHIWITGELPPGTVDFDPNPNTYELTVSNFEPDLDLFIANYTNSGELLHARIFNEEVGQTSTEQIAELAVGFNNSAILTGTLASGMINFGTESSPLLLSGGEDTEPLDTPSDLLVTAFDENLEPILGYVIEDSRVNIRPELAVSSTCPNYVLTGNLRRDASFSIENAIRPFDIETSSGDKDNMFILSDSYEANPTEECSISPTLPTSTKEGYDLKTGIKAWPNPTTDLIQIAADNHIGEVSHFFSLLNHLGQQLATFELSSGTKVIDLSGYPDGVYYLHSVSSQQPSLRIIKY